ncbi:MFS transporter [Phycicoccus endophyticus]|uniref:MFS transporter n=1 Tax=Phycicoccus endophyticus TaxID=1690220 RepID=A0A7G9R5G6_9MICO|nr:MFS transporter [Phycicoccus endophyticus]NHI19648.1 MFS transporter [Phycicoccus endophyticus]QNN50841.1 MFS transporter [Phycicoccus endophyticus]
MRSLLPDLTPFRRSADYRRLWTGFTLSNVGSQMAVVAIGLQVYDLTGSTASVGVVGLFALVPLVVMGLYGGALADHHDRRLVGLVSTLVAFGASVVAAGQAWAGLSSVTLLYAVVALWSGAFAVSSPARSSIYPRLLDPELLPAANALSVFAMNTALTAGPLLAGVLVDWGGYRAAYTTDAVLTLAALNSLWRLHPVPPDRGEGEVARRVGLRSVLDGFAFLRTAPNVRMTFVADIAAMLLAQPRVLFPAAGAVILGGGASTVGALYAAAAVGGIVAMTFSGRLGGVRRQGTAILVSVAGWGVGISGLGVALLGAGGALTREQALVGALLAMGFAGAADSVSAVFRTTILQAAAPDRMRGRLQGVFVVVVAGGPRLGELAGGGVAERLGEGWTAVWGGAACVVAVVVLGLVQPGFVRYDARHPTP